MKVTVGVPTKNRYEALAICLSSIAMQTKKPDEVIIVDDSDDPKDMREIPNFQYIFELFNYYKISFKVIYGLKKGQHFSHQHIQEIASNDWIWRIDDDEVAEPNVLQMLCDVVEGEDNVGAVAPLVLMPNPSPLPAGLDNNSISDLTSPNIQWFDWAGTIEVEHLNSSFIYKKGIANYNLELSPVAHREETLFTYDIKRAGYRLFVCGAKVWHFRQASGGIRSTRDPSMYDWDERIFQAKLKSYGVVNTHKIIVLDSGLGDHWSFKHILPLVKDKYPKVTLAVCYPEVFEDEDVKLISIAEAKNMMGNIDEQNIYRKMIDWGWRGSIVDAYKKLHL